uniref:Uncharacterized protein n=1 Tax=Anopheles atroparvus TaxID=41427 RepID=A0AAG5DKU5_ANOAO
MRPVAHHRLGVEVQPIRAVELAGASRLAFVELAAGDAGQQDGRWAVAQRTAAVRDAVQRACHRGIAGAWGFCRRWNWSGSGSGSRGWCRCRCRSGSRSWSWGWCRSRSRRWHWSWTAGRGAGYTGYARIARDGRVAAGALWPIAGVLLRVEVQQGRAVHGAGERTRALVELGAVVVRKQDRLRGRGRAVGVGNAIVLNDLVVSVARHVRITAHPLWPVAGLFGGVVVQPDRAEVLAGIAAVALVELAAVTVR